MSGNDFGAQNMWFDDNEWFDKRVVYAPINDKGDKVIDWITTENSGLIKLASAGKTTYHRKIAQYIQEKARPRPGWACCVISALGSYEVWGQNVNGDRFPRIMFQEGQHKTYERCGLPFKHHLNKPYAHTTKIPLGNGQFLEEHHAPHPVYGERVTLAEFNPIMDRVELIVWYDLSKDTNLLSDLSTGAVGVSMGMKTPFDTCTIRGCGNVAKDPSKYCIHSHPELRKKYGYFPGYTFPDGQQIGRWNRYARFFDISRVFIPAWEPGRIMEKVASDNRVGGKYWNIPIHFHENSAILATKIASTEKTADIVKTITPQMQSNPRAATTEFLSNAAKVQESFEPALPSSLLNRLAERFDLKNIVSTMSTLGVVPRPREFQRMVLIKVGKKQLADELEKEACVFTIFEPRLPQDPSLIAIRPELCLEKIANELAPYMQSRSCIRPILMARLEKIAMNVTATNQNYNVSVPPQKNKDRRWSKEIALTMAGIGGLYALLRGALAGGKPISIEGKPVMPTMAELGLESMPPGTKVENSLEHFMESSPVIKMLVLAAIGGSALTAMKKLNENHIVGNYDQPPGSPLVDYNLDYRRGLQNLNASPMTKVGWDAKNTLSMLRGPEARTTGKTLKRALIGVPAAYMIAGTMEAARAADPYADQRPEGTVHKILRQDPELGAIGFTFLPHIKDLGMGLIKKASLGEDVRDFGIMGVLGASNPMLGVAGGVADALMFNAVTKAAEKIGERLAKRAKQAQPNPKNMFGLKPISTL